MGYLWPFSVLHKQQFFQLWGSCDSKSKNWVGEVQGMLGVAELKKVLPLNKRNVLYIAISSLAPFLLSSLHALATSLPYMPCNSLHPHSPWKSVPQNSVPNLWHSSFIQHTLKQLHHHINPNLPTYRYHFSTYFRGSSSLSRFHFPYCFHHFFLTNSRSLNWPLIPPILLSHSDLTHSPHS